MIDRIIINLCTADLTATKAFYQQLFDMKTVFESDWYIQLHGKEGQLELGIIDVDNDIVPIGLTRKAGGYYLTFVIDDVDTLYAKAKVANVEVLQAPQDTFYGQRRLLLRDPNGAVVDVSAPIADFQG